MQSRRTKTRQRAVARRQAQWERKQRKSRVLSQTVRIRLLPMHHTFATAIAAAIVTAAVS
jgi:hypothetical protein